MTAVGVRRAALAVGKVVVVVVECEVRV